MPYKDIDPHSGAGWPHSMVFPAVIAALKLFMGLEERCNFNNHQIFDDQEYILQSGISTLAFGFSHYNKEFIHDSCLICGLDYQIVSADQKSCENVIGVIKKQLQRGYPVIIQDKTNNAAFLFVSGVTSDGK